MKLPAPRRVSVKLDATVGSGGEGWDLGIVLWRATGVASWWDVRDDVDVLADAVAAHTGRPFTSYGNSEPLREELQKHDLAAFLDDGGDVSVPVVEAGFAQVHLGDQFAAASGRRQVVDGEDLWCALDDHSATLGVVGELIADLAGVTGGPFSERVLNVYPEAGQASSLLVLDSIRTHPLFRGERLGAWTAAAVISVLARSSTLVVAQAAPMTWDDVPGVAAGGEWEYRFSSRPAEDVQEWQAVARGIATHWSTSLGLTLLDAPIQLLAWYSDEWNPALARTLTRWSC